MTELPDNILDVDVTFGGDIRKPEEVYSRNLSLALNRIKTGASKATLERVRIGELEKTKLPYVCFSGVFSLREEASLIKHSGLIVLDFDQEHLKGLSAEDFKNNLKKDPFIYAAWISPSYGVKALVQIDDPKRHRDHFRALQSKYLLDASGSDPSRACFESYDPEIYINTGAFVYSEYLEKKEETYSGSNSSVARVNSDWSAVQKAANMIQRSEDGEKHRMLNNAAYLIGGLAKNGYVDGGIAREILKYEISRKDNVKDLQAAYRTVEKGLRDGYNDPIHLYDRKKKEIYKEFGESVYSYTIEPDDVMTELLNRFDNIHQRTWSTGWKELDQNFVWKKNKLVANIGHAKAGKTLASLNLAVATAVNHNWKWIIYAIENTEEDIYQELMELVIGKRMDKTGDEKKDKYAMNEDEFAYAMQFVNEYFKIINPASDFSLDEILSKSEELLSNKVYQYLLIDPFNALPIKSNVNSYQYVVESANKLRNWTRKNCGVLINLHTKTEARMRRKEKDAIRKPIPFSIDAEHGATWENKSDTVLITDRDRYAVGSERFITTILVEAERNTKLGGEPHQRVGDPGMDGFRTLYNFRRFEDQDGNFAFELPYKRKGLHE